jgi:L-2-hydroxyglutarate oxidase LhgO
MEAALTLMLPALPLPADAAAIDGFPVARLPPQRYAQGCYFALSGRAPFSRLIYPLPTDGGLGVHLTLDLAGQAKFGPDVEWIDDVTSSADLGRELDDSVDTRRADAFASEVRRYWPRLPDGALAPAYSGIRPKLSGPGKPAADFRLDGPADHGCEGVVQLFGIESPGLTASLAIADVVAGLVTDSAAV